MDRDEICRTCCRSDHRVGHHVGRHEVCRDDLYHREACLCGHDRRSRWSAVCQTCSLQICSPPTCSHRGLCVHHLGVFEADNARRKNRTYRDHGGGDLDLYPEVARRDDGYGVGVVTRNPTKKMSKISFDGLGAAWRLVVLRLCKHCVPDT